MAIVLVSSNGATLDSRTVRWLSALGHSVSGLGRHTSVHIAKSFYSETSVVVVVVQTFHFATATPQNLPLNTVSEISCFCKGHLLHHRLESHGGLRNREPIDTFQAESE